MQSLEDDKDPVRVLWIDADAIVVHSEFPVLIIATDFDVNLRLTITTILDGIPHQILKQLDELHIIGQHERKWVV